MKVVLDTNILISGIFWSGQPGEILDLWIDNHFTLIVSEDIFSEYISVSSILHKKYKAKNLDEILDLVAMNAHFVDPQGVEHPKCTDSNDDMFLAAAVCGKAKYFVSGDKALLKVGAYKGGFVVTPKTFLQNFAI